MPAGLFEAEIPYRALAKPIKHRHVHPSLAATKAKAKASSNDSLGTDFYKIYYVGLEARHGFGAIHGPCCNVLVSAGKYFF
jgi:hypothetical protein